VRQNVHWLYSDEVDWTVSCWLCCIGLEQGVEFVNQNLLGNHTHNLIDNLTLFEKQQWGQLDAILRCNAHIIVNVQLADFGLSCKTQPSIMGLIMRHGPHQGAQKSTRTGVVLFRTSCSKLSSVSEMPVSLCHSYGLPNTDCKGI